MENENTLRVWHNEIDFVIAHSKEEAVRLYCEHTGDTGQSHEEGILDFAEFKPDHMFTFIDKVEETRTCEEWCKLRGAGYFCSLDF